MSAFQKYIRPDSGRQILNVFSRDFEGEAQVIEYMLFETHESRQGMELLGREARRNWRKVVVNENKIQLGEHV